VHMQVLALTRKLQVNLLLFFAARVLQGLLSAALTAGVLAMLPEGTAVPASAQLHDHATSGSPQGAVVLRADASDAAAWQAALTLSRMARYVHLDTGPGQDALAARLRRTVGLGSGGGEPVLEVCLGHKSGGVRPALYLGRQSAARQRLELWTPQLQGEESLLCALFQAEKLQIEDIQIRFVEFRA